MRDSHTYSIDVHLLEPYISIRRQLLGYIQVVLDMLPRFVGTELLESGDCRTQQQPRIGARLRLRAPALQGTDAAVPLLYTIRSRCTYDSHSLKTLSVAECYERPFSLRHESVAWQQT
ncbi:hypothetical protein IG631_05534 [Alternaria alternata]|nr:hypothetical protein IG631_05534 [Alternaria alternata]